MKYKFLLFDLDHTLMDFDKGEDIALTQFLEEMGVDDIARFKSVYQEINKQMWRDLEKGRLTKSELINTRFEKAFEQFDRQVDGEKLALLYQEYLSKQGQIFSGADTLLEELTQRGYHIYGATNGVTYIQENRLVHSSIKQYFKEIFISEQMGTQKPAIEFYQQIAKVIPNFKKSQTVMIGDSLTADIKGGNNAGIDTIWYNHHLLKNTTDAVPTYTIASYEDLLELL